MQVLFRSFTSSAFSGLVQDDDRFFEGKHPKGARHPEGAL
jgi:hypothetical protein